MTNEINDGNTTTPNGVDKTEGDNKTFFSLERSIEMLNNDPTALNILKEGNLWLMRSNFLDYDGDNEKELAMITSNANCGSCHQNELRIIKKGKVIFYKDTYEVDIWPAKKFPGFMIKHPIFKIGESPIYPSEGIVESYKVSKDGAGVETFIKISERKEPYTNVGTSTKLPDWNSYPAKELGDDAYYQEWSLNKKPIKLIFDKLPKSVEQHDEEKILFFVNKYGPNFADHYTVVTLGCGTQCQYFVVVDDLTGIVYDPKLGSAWGADFNGDSTLFIISPPETLNSQCYSNSPNDNPFCKDTNSEYYVWEDNHFDLIGEYKVLFEVEKIDQKIPNSLKEIKQYPNTTLNPPPNPSNFLYTFDYWEEGLNKEWKEAVQKTVWSADDFAALKQSHECAEKVLNQTKYLQYDQLADTETFEKYRADDFLKIRPADLDINSNIWASVFMTLIRNDMNDEKNSFAGHYAIATIGMTGWPSGYVIINKKNGKAYTVPYQSTFLDFKKDSKLLILNSKPAIMDQMRLSSSYQDYCDSNFPIVNVADERPFYFVWESDTLRLIGPKNIKPPANEFFQSNPKDWLPNRTQ
ncbi:MAG: hypothetical protein AAB969_00225 [Patescibacteria group bacterium]